MKPKSSRVCSGLTATQTFGKSRLPRWRPAMLGRFGRRPAALGSEAAVIPSVALRSMPLPILQAAPSIVLCCWHKLCRMLICLRRSPRLAPPCPARLNN